MSLAAYKRTIRESESPRQVERRVLSQATHDIEKFAAAFDATDDKVARTEILSSGLRDALYRNQVLWAALRDDLSVPGNAIPNSLKAQLISIALWVDRQTHALMGGSGTVRGLVEINTNIIAGLAGQANANQLQEA